MRTLTLLSLSLLGGLWTTPTAKADCFPTVLFEAVDAADRIVVGRMGSRPANIPSGTVRVQRVLKGPRLATFAYSGDPFTSNVEAGHRYLFILDAQNNALTCGNRDLGHQSADGRAIVRAIPRYLAAAPAEQAMLLVGWATGSGELASQSALWLAANPAYAAHLSNAQKRALLGALRTSEPGEHTYNLGYALARAEVLDAIPVLIDRAGDPGYNARPLLAALELLTNRHDAGYRRGHDVHGAELAGIQRRWRAWYENNASMSRAELVAAGYRERGVAIPRDGSARAEVIRTAPDDLSRTVALAACETSAAGAPRLPDYAMGNIGPTDWTDLATRCATP